mmetsp:Transcript_41975/g.96383  ORF Transcript_41975/g.96383 Transcript_41975/m.96383 type:complete len:474 (+) Transcript_41975:53-1474(+)
MIPIEDDETPSRHLAAARSKSPLGPVPGPSARPPSSSERQPPQEQPVVMPASNANRRTRGSMRSSSGGNRRQSRQSILAMGNKLLPQRSRLQLVDSYTAAEFAPNYELKMSRKEVSDVPNMIGRARRSEVTGLVSFQDGEVSADSDFTLVDFWTRKSISGLPPQLEKDVYIFRAIPMKYRTWLYHQLYNEGMVYSTSGDDKHSDIDGMLKHVLSSSCIDVDVSAGRWAPTMCYAPVALGAAFAGDMTFTTLASLMLIAMAFITRVMNHPAVYRYSRPVTLPIRVGFLIYTCILLPGEFQEVLAHTLAVICALVDLVLGDLMMVLQYRHTCYYTVIRMLGQRVYVCRRHGAATSRFYQGKPMVDEYVSGVGAWDSSMVVITDVQGIVMTLEPVTRNHWEMLLDEAHTLQEPMHFLGLDVYNEFRSSAFAGCEVLDDTQSNWVDEEELRLNRRDWNSFMKRAEAFIKPGLPGADV